MTIHVKPLKYNMIILFVVNIKKILKVTLIICFYHLNINVGNIPLSMISSEISNNWRIYCKFYYDKTFFEKNQNKRNNIKCYFLQERKHWLNVVNKVRSL